MIKVLHCYKTYYPDTFGGIEQVIYQLAEGGRKENIQASVFVHSPDPQSVQFEKDNHTVYRVKSLCELASTPFSLQAVAKFRALAQHADIVHYHFPYPFMDFMHFAAGIDKPCVVSYHSDIVKQKTLALIYAPLMKRFLQRVDAIVAASPNYVETSPVLKHYREKVKVIPYGLDKKFYINPPAVDVEKWQKRFPMGFFLFIGTFRYYKGLHILIEAAKNSQYPIVIVGAGPIEQELREQAKSLAVDNIHFVGALDDEDKATLLSLCTAIVFPSHLRSEAFGISLLEGALYSKPLISSEIGTGTTYINLDKQTGLVVPPADPVALRQAMDRLWNEPDYAKQLGQGAYQRFEQLFTAEKMIKSYTNLYKSLLNG